MANNKIQLADGTVLLDVSNVTVTATSLLSGETAVDKSGALINGGLVVHRYDTGATDPPASVGSNGDLFLVVG